MSRFSLTTFPQLSTSGLFAYIPNLLCKCSLCAVIALAAFILNHSVVQECVADDFPAVFNTEAEGQHPPTPQEMLGLIELPAGFHATLFASEPEVQQPICMDFDDRGRLWVAENYTYSGGAYETKLRDRIVILSDTDGDGRHDSRQVFWDKGYMLTSLTWGFGGLFILHDGTLSFIPDRNGDDVPDSDPQILLDGWSKECGHNFVSGLTWGPDGWLYGRHGIVDTSYPGVPGTPQSERPRMNCGVWRYHPTRHLVEVVCSGTTNPWGLDYNADGQFFMTNNVQGHLWHVIPGAHYQRMYGQDFNPHAYELMDMTADHYHWDTKTKWTESRDGVANDLGGGHSHVGGMIYEGDHFPQQYRGKIFMCNTHGRRINVNSLPRHGSGYVGTREPDFMLVKNAWFRGVDIKLGPEGGMYVADWSDNGECHDHDGIHRTSGRIYRITYGQLPLTDVPQALQSASLERFDWAGRHARRLLQEKVALDPAAHKADQSTSLASLLLRESLGQNSPTHIQQALRANDPLTVAYAVQLACADAPSRSEHLRTLTEVAAKPQSANVLLALVSVLQKYETDGRWTLASAILGCKENTETIAGENNLTLMTWYGIEPVVSHDGALKLLRSNKKLQQFAMRRCAFEISTQPQVAAAALEHIGQSLSAREPDTERIVELLSAFKAGLAGRAHVDAPATWPAIEKRLRATKRPEITLAADALSVIFGDGAALDDLRKLASKSDLDAVAREQAIRALAQAKDLAAIPILFNLLNDRAVADTAIEALRGFDHPDTARQLLSRWPGFRDGNKTRALDTLISRQPYALEMIKWIEDGRLDARELTAAQVRQLQAFGNEQIQLVIESKWGVVQDTPQARVDAIQRWKKQLTSATLAKANHAAGAETFKKACANCHKLYGEGQTIAPDLTGANRGNLEYLLINIVDPSAVVPKQFTTSVIALKEGRVITGVIISETEQSLVVQTDKEQLTIARDDIEATRHTGKSLMPDGMLDSLTPEQVRDLFGFIMPKATGG